MTQPRDTRITPIAVGNSADDDHNNVRDAVPDMHDDDIRGRSVSETTSFGIRSLPGPSEDSSPSGTRTVPTHPPAPSGYGSSTPRHLQLLLSTLTIHRGKGSVANVDNGNVERGNREDDGGAGRSIRDNFLGETVTARTFRREDDRRE